MEKELKFCSYELKEVTEEGQFSGYASLFDKEPDSYGDIIEKGAFLRSLQTGGRNRNGVAMLKQHDSSKPIGIWTKLTEDSTGLMCEGKLAVKCNDGHDVYELMKMGAIKGLSIGYTAQKILWDEEKQVRTLKEVDLWEISPVTFPAKIGCNISNIKSIESAKNERDLENALRESGLSKSASQYIVKLCKPQLRESVEDGEFKKILETLREVNKNLF